MKILITGATGLLGSHLIKTGLENGHEIHALVRNISPRTYIHTQLNHPQLQVIEGDLFSPPVESKYDVIVHAAAMVTSDQRKSEEINRINNEGTKTIFNNYHNDNIKWVQISSISTMCSGHNEVINETYQGNYRDTPYAKSKFQADCFIEKMSKNALIIHPTFMLGEWDSKPSSGAILFALKFKKIKSILNNYKNFVAAKDVAEGIFQALTHNVSGHYILGNENLEIMDFINLAANELNIHSDIKITEIIKNDDYIMQEFCQSSKISINKAINDFGYNPKTSTRFVLKETVDYFEKYKILKRSIT